MVSALVIVGSRARSLCGGSPGNNSCPTAALLEQGYVDAEQQFFQENIPYDLWELLCKRCPQA